MLAPLGDPYTRFLAPAQYDSLYGVATGSVAGIGVSLFQDEVSFEDTALMGTCDDPRG
jgi:C-terminal processing protease CtpA/Prc